MKWLTALLVLIGTISAHAQAPFPDGVQTHAFSMTTPQKLDDLAQLLDDPDIRRWIEEQTKRWAQAAAPIDNVPHHGISVGDIAREVTVWEERARSQLQAMTSSIPLIPVEIERGLLRLRANAAGNDHVVASIALVLLVVLGVTAEWLLRRKWLGHGRSVEHYLPAAVFAAIVAVLFFAIEWPLLARLVAACYFGALIAYRFITVGIQHAAHPEIHKRLRIILGLALIATASMVAGTILHVDENALQATAFLASIIILALAIELAWHKIARSVAARIALCLHLAGVWLLWCLGFKTLFWLGIYIVVLPSMLRAIGHALSEHIAGHFLIPPTDSRNVLFVRGARAVVIGVAIAWIALVWEIDGYTVDHGYPQITSVFDGLLKSIFVILLADLVWHLAKAAIDRNVVPAIMPAPGGAEADGASQELHSTRLHTLLPILRSVLAVALCLVAGLSILGQLGVDVGPLIAGAGIFGVAIGFGSQALVRDVISGIFYLFDDAFRVGEYIQAKNYKGTVEGFSLRSVKLRHHRGPLFTVPFGELGAVENMSRDWSKVKFSVTLPYDTDIEKARKIGKAIGQELLNDSELGSLFIQPLKMKGVEEFGEYGIVVSFAMVTVPTSKQSFIRRSAYAMLREAFQKNGIAFAQPMIQVGGETTSEAAAAALRHHQELSVAKPDQ